MKRSLFLAFALSFGLTLAACNSQPDPDKFDSWKTDYDKMMKEQDKKLEEIKNQGLDKTLESTPQIEIPVPQQGTSATPGQPGTVSLVISPGVMKDMKDHMTVSFIHDQEIKKEVPSFAGGTSYSVTPGIVGKADIPEDLTYINLGCDLSEYQAKIRGHKEIVVGSPEFEDHAADSTIKVVKPVQADLLFICKTSRKQPMRIQAFETIMKNAEFEIIGDDVSPLKFLDIESDYLTLIGESKIITRGVTAQEGKRGPSVKLAIGGFLEDGHLEIESHSAVATDIQAVTPDEKEKVSAEK